MSCKFLVYVFSPKTSIEFTVPATQERTTRGLSRAIEDRRVFYFNLLETNPRITIEPLDSEVHVIDVPKGGLYLVGIIVKEDGAWNLQGNIHAGSFDLDSLPVSEEAENTISLGELIYEGNYFVPSIDDEALSNGLGLNYEVLRQIGMNDSGVMKMLNPDVNRNGEIDYEEGFTWELIAGYNFDISNTLEEYSTFSGNSITIDDHLSISSIGGYMFYTTEQFGRFFNEDEISLFRMEFPPGLDIQRDGVNITEILPHLVGPPNDDVTYMGQDAGAFAAYDTRGLEPPPPYNGDYTIHINTETYLIRNVNFYQHSNNFEGLPVPLYQLDTDADGKALAVSWKWAVIENGMLIPATEEAVNQMLKDFDIGFSVPGGGDDIKPGIPDTWAAGGTMEVSSWNIDMHERHLGFWAADLGGNHLGYAAWDTYLGTE